MERREREEEVEQRKYEMGRRVAGNEGVKEWRPIERETIKGNCFEERED